MGAESLTDEEWDAAMGEFLEILDERKKAEGIGESSDDISSGGITGKLWRDGTGDAYNPARPIGADKLTEGAGKGKIPWDSWGNYEKVTTNGQEYAKVGDRLYSRHAVDRMQPSGKRYTVGDAIVQAGGVSGRTVAPQFVEDVINSVKPCFNLRQVISFIHQVRLKWLQTNMAMS